MLFFIPEDILKRDNAIWMSPDGTKVVYATFNDTNVQQVRWKLYGGEDNNDDHLDPYPKEKFMRYPKVIKISRQYEKFVSNQPWSYIKYVVKGGPQPHVILYLWQ